jgi:hypothetical protein
MIEPLPNWVKFYMEKKYSRIEINPRRVGEVLKTKFLYVPPNQRDYSWLEKHVKDLLGDLNNAVAGNAAEYFLGTIVTAKDDEDGDKPRVVDGQQRLATTLIFLGAIRDYLDERQDADARKIESMFLFSPVIGEDDMPRMTLNAHDREYFTRRILLPKSDQRRKDIERERPKKPSHILIDDAAKKARAHVNFLTKNLGPTVAKEVLMKQIRFLEKGVIVIWVEVPDDKSAYTIFETMNDRGLDLSATDLIKNHLFNLAGDQVDDAANQWSSMVAILESVQETDIVKDFVRHFWISHYEPVRAQELFGAIKDRAENKTNGMELLSKFHASSAKYVALLNPMHGFWEGYTERSRRNISTLGQLNLKQARPLLLSVIERFPKHDIEKVLRLAVSWSVRFLVSGDLGSGALETEYGKNAIKVSNGDIKNADELALAMSSIVPADDAFQNAFATIRVAKAATARYYLRGLELQARGNVQPENVPNDDQTDITLEHVLPEDPKQGEWLQFTQEDREQFTNRLGNLALLKRSENSGKGNEEFQIKRPVYAQSSFKLTSDLASVSNWNTIAITDRQRNLATIAVKAWPIKI